MAKGISYGPNAALIQGSAVANKNWDNVPGMYAGLDKVVKGGKDIIKAVGEKRKEEKLKNDILNKKYEQDADKVLMSAGALGDKMYNHVTGLVTDLQGSYMKGVGAKDKTQQMNSRRDLANLSTWVQGHKQTGLDYAENIKNKELSSYYEKNPWGREEAHLRNQIMAQEYTDITTEDGEQVFHCVDLNGNSRKVTDSEYQDFGIPKNSTITLSYLDVTKEANRSRTFDADMVRSTINSSLPENDREFIAAMYDDHLGKDFKNMLATSKTLDREIINAIDPTGWDSNEDGILDPEEKDAFIDAATNPDNLAFNLENSRLIFEDQLVNAAEQKHKQYWRDKEAAASSASRAATPLSESAKLALINEKNTAKSTSEAIEAGVTSFGDFSGPNVTLEGNNWEFKNKGVIAGSISKYDKNAHQLIVNHMTGTTDIYGAPEVEGFGQGWTGGTTMQANFPKTEIKSRIEE